MSTITIVFPASQAKDYAEGFSDYKPENADTLLQMLREKFFMAFLLPTQDTYKTGAPLEVVYFYTRIRTLMEAAIKGKSDMVVLEDKDVEILDKSIKEYTGWQIAAGELIMMVNRSIELGKANAHV